MAASARNLSSQSAGTAPSKTSLSRARISFASHGAIVVLLAWSALVTLLLARFSVDSRLVFIDESNAVLLGRFIDADPGQLFSGSIARGPERLTSWLAGITAAVTHDPADQFELLHFMTSLAQGLVAIPIWLAARQLGLSRWAALVPATVASAGSFAFYGAMTLNTSVGTLSCALMLWAMLRALRRPGLFSDVLIVATLGLTVVARLGWAPLVGAMAPAALATIWFARPDGERFVRWVKLLPGRLLKRHPLLTVGAVGLLLALAVVGPDPLVGGSQYGGVRLRPQFDLSILWDNTRILASHLALGTAIVPFVLALPLLVRGLGRPADAVEGGFAWLVLGYVLIFSYAYYYSMNEDRYFAVLAAPFVLAGALAIFKKPPPLWSTAVSGVAVAVLVATSYRWPVGDVYGYFIAPTSRFFSDVVIGKASVVLPVGRQTIAWLLLAATAVAAVVLVALARRSVPARLRWAAGAIAIAALLTFQLAATYHPAKKFVDAVGMKDVPEGDLEFIDHAVAAQERSDPLPFGAAEPLDDDGTIHPDLAAQMPFLQVYNRSLGYRFPVEVTGDDGVETPVPGQAPVQLDWTTGKVDLRRAAPDVLVTTAGQATIGFDSTPIRGSERFPWAAMERLRSPLRAEWVLRGALPDRFAERGVPQRLRVFPHGDERCVTGIVNPHPTTDRAVRFRLTGGVRTARGSVSPGRPTPFTVRVTRPTTLFLNGGAGRLPDGTWRAPGLFNVTLGVCRGG